MQRSHPRVWDFYRLGLIGAYHQMAEPLPERSYPLPSPQPSRELLEASWGLDLTPERDVKPRERLRKSKAPKRLEAHDEGLADEGTCVP